MRAGTVLWDRFNGKWHLAGVNPWPIVKGATACESCRILAAGKVILQGSNGYGTELISGHLFLRKKKFWNAAIASGERIRSPKN
jgi:hypothetical protein